MDNVSTREKELVAVFVLAKWGLKEVHYRIGTMNQADMLLDLNAIRQILKINDHASTVVLDEHRDIVKKYKDKTLYQMRNIITEHNSEY